MIPRILILGPPAEDEYLKTYAEAVRFAGGDPVRDWPDLSQPLGEAAIGRFVNGVDGILLPGGDDNGYGQEVAPMIYAGCDAHKRYSLFVLMNERGPVGRPIRVEHDRILYRRFLEDLPRGTSIAVETIGSWYWMIDEMEAAGHNPILAHARKAKLMMGQINKTDKLDAGGLAQLLRNGTLPEVWIPPKEVRDQRELPRMRMALVRMRTTLKNRIQATLAKYAITIDDTSDVFGKKGRAILAGRLAELPPQTRLSVEMELGLLDQVEGQIVRSEEQIRGVVAETPAIQLLMTLPGVGLILGVVLALEIGDVDRFGSAERLASYAGTVPRIAASGGKIRYGRTRPDVNHYLKWGFSVSRPSLVFEFVDPEGNAWFP